MNIVEKVRVNHILRYAHKNPITQKLHYDKTPQFLKDKRQMYYEL